MSKNSIKRQNAPTPVAIQPKLLIHQEQFDGPLPHPDMLEKYQKVGVLDVVIKLAMDANDRATKSNDAEIQAKNAEVRQFELNQEQDRKVQKAFNFGYIFGSIFLSLLVLMVFCATVYFAAKGQVYASIGFGATGLYGFFRYLGNFLKKEGK